MLFLLKNVKKKKKYHKLCAREQIKVTKKSGSEESLGMLKVLPGSGFLFLPLL